MPRPNSVQSSTSCDRIAGLPQLPDEDKRYRINAAHEKKPPECLALNSFGPSIGDPDDQYWKDRIPARNAKSTTTPLLFTQGAAETNTLPVGTEKFLDKHRGPQRPWGGSWDHVHGNERTHAGSTRWAARPGSRGGALTFFDEHLKGTDPKLRFPNDAVQDNLGDRRVEQFWPTANRSANLRLGRGSYTPLDGQRVGERPARRMSRYVADGQGRGRSWCRVELLPRLWIHARVTPGCHVWDARQVARGLAMERPARTFSRVSSG
ncbi:hypothetical protein MMF93_18035 [Streptomyces tubbatahanensis]|uniref:Uncharacterized protein n=1 Tax=Streptomyces tubbatahanensis TaxID=2923272 RepID=A0ABY3XUI1_9ACTN|nr:hypothetical protein [Streptomyces tubbatahanensis]UNS98141.1 hypothetical protein MMF93_18035 [Streptomyces tubbatahanensis]